MIIIIISLASGIIYKKKNKFIAEELFLIHQGGTLITHLTRHKQANVDDIIFSGMFTAVQEFIKNSFVSDSREFNKELDQQWLLDELKLGEKNILVERSENTYIAVIYSGEGSKPLRRLVVRLLDKIESEFKNYLSTWDGNLNQLKGTDEILSPLIKIPVEKNEVKEEPTDDYIVPQFESLTPTYTPTISPKPQIKESLILSRPLGEAQAIKQPKIIPQIKNRYRFSSKSKALTNLPLDYSLAKTFSNKRFKYLQLALQHDPLRKYPMIIEIKKDRIMIEDIKETQSEKLPTFLDTEKNTRTVNVKMSEDSKEVKIDPRRSLLQQLIEMDEE
jgi:hypothetical protein